MKIITEYSLWFIFLCITISALVSFFAYWKKFPDNISKFQQRILPALRFIATFLLCILLLNPLIIRNVKEIEKPLIIIAHDNSNSIILSKDSVFYKNTFSESLDKQIEILKNQYETRELTFGSNIQNGLNLSYNEQETDLSELFVELKTLYAGRNVGAIVLISDGIYNKGINPYFLAEQIPFPIYSVLLGDTLVKKDLKITKVFANKSVFKGNSFPMEINVAASLLSGETAVLSIENEGKEVFRKQIQIVGNSFSETIRLYIESSKPGVQKYSIKIHEIDGENTFLNNRYEVFVEVMDRKDKILLVYQAPHPDITAIKQALLSNESYFVDEKQIDEISDLNLDYQLVIMHQLPTSNNASTLLLNRINQQHIPVFYIIGNKTDLSAFNRVNSGLQINQSKNIFNDAFLSVNQNFVLFSVSGTLAKTLEKLPPLSVPFGTYKTSNSANILLFQRIGQIVSDMPLLMFSEIDNNRNGVLCGEGIWRWRTAIYQQTSEHLLFDELLTKIAQYLMVSNDRSNFRVTHKQVVGENEEVFFNAELYNDAMERINDAEVTMIIKDEEGKSFPFEFSRTLDAYELNAGKFPSGNYYWEANSAIGSKKYTKKGVFTIQKLAIESLNLLADKNLMMQLAKIHNGEMIYYSQIDKLAEKIKNNSSIRSVELKTKKYTNLGSFWIYFMLIVALFASEWFIRKLNGMS